MNYIHNHDDYATEPVRGLPAALPRGEFVLWQGAPSWRAFARQVFHTRLIGLLVAAGAIARFALALNSGAPVPVALGEATVIVVFGLVGLSILMLLAWLVGRTTVYTITNKRIVMRIGVAIQKTFNIPFAQMDSAALRVDSRDVGNVSVALKPGVSIAYLILWPHVRPWKMGQTQPTLRALPQASVVARLLTDAFTSHVQTAEMLSRSGVPAQSRAAQDATPSASASKADASPASKDPHYIPKPLVMMAAAAALLTVIVVAIAQWTGVEGLRSNDGAPDFAREIAFVPLGGDRIAVRNTTDEAVITTVEAGSDGLLRGALRGLSMTRDHAGQPLDAPYQLQRFSDDGVYLYDPLTNRSIRLESFGPLETGATADLLRLGRTGTN